MMRYDLIADWSLNRYCNFRCPYCYIGLEDRENEGYRGNDVPKIINAFDHSGKTWLIHMSGGEPFLHPDFIDLCKGLIRNHYLSINTNLTHQLVYDFCERIEPERVSFIHCSLHIIDRGVRKLINDFTEKVKVLETSGFIVYVTQVTWPPIIPEFNKIFEFFRRQGILIRPKLFRGKYKGEEYPGSYTEEEKRILQDIMKRIDEMDGKSGKMKGHINPDMERQWMNGHVSFKDQPCLAGSKFVFIDFWGNVRRCAGDPMSLGNIYQGRLKLFEQEVSCRMPICGCPYYGFNFARGEPTVVRSISL